MLRATFLLVLFAISMFAQDGPDYETEEAKRKWKNGYFGVTPHYPNYLLPFGITSKPYKSYILSDEYKKYEAALQVSLKLEVTENLFGFDEEYFFSYTHTAMWQVYADSSPFRETNYNPEAFVVIPLALKLIPSLRSFQIGLSHISNGQGDNRDIVYPDGFENPGHRSRSMNSLQLMASFEHENLYTNIRVWVPNRHNENLKDNYDITDYYGYGSVQMRYFYKKHMVT
ncbi:MAG: phospholipase A, partial [Sulfurimonadaceae bacterium]|nr:phospholipase A [Sulfurimonadaceae bacterium]